MAREGRPATTFPNSKNIFGVIQQITATSQTCNNSNASLSLLLRVPRQECEPRAALQNCQCSWYKLGRFVYLPPRSQPTRPRYLDFPCLMSFSKGLVFDLSISCPCLSILSRFSTIECQRFHEWPGNQSTDSRMVFRIKRSCPIGF
jgi:hypothetical protein